MKFIQILLIIASFANSLGKLPPTIPRCRRNDPNISQCIAKAIEQLRPQFISGDFGGGIKVPKIDPMYFQEMDFGNDQGLDVKLFNVNVHGTSNFKIEKLRTNLKTLKFDALITIPKLTTFAKYRMNFDFFGNQLKTSGDYFIVYENVKLIVQLKLKRFTNNGIEHINFEQIPTKFSHEKTTQLKISNLFGGNKAIEEIIHAIIINNQNFAAVNVVIEESLSKFFTNIANTIIGSATFDEMFPL